MMYLRLWLDKIGEDSKAFSSHSMRRSATTHAHKMDIPDVDIQRMGRWKSNCYKSYIQDDISTQVATCFKFNNR